MYDESDYINPYHGMELLPGFEEGTRDNENGILFLVEYFYLKYELGKLGPSDITIFNNIVSRLRTFKADGKGRYQGLFDRGEGESLTIPKSNLRTISHDNITAILSFSAMFSQGWEKYIYQHGKSNLWRYDNVYPEDPRITRTWLPRDIIYYSRLGGSTFSKSLAWCFMWVFYLEQMYTCFKKYDVRPTLFQKLVTFFKTRKWAKEQRRNIATSGKLLAFVRLFPLRRRSVAARMVWWACTKLVKRNFKEGWGFVFSYYFSQPGHPNKILAQKLFLGS